MDCDLISFQEQDPQAGHQTADHLVLTRCKGAHIELLWSKCDVPLPQMTWGLALMAQVLAPVVLW